MPPRIPSQSVSGALEVDRILQGECVEEMARLPSRSVDVLFADPPYFLQLEKTLRRPNLSVVSGVEEDWDRFKDFAEYDAFNRAWLSEARRLLKDDGTLWVMGTYHNIYRLGSLLQDLGFWILNDVLWVKTNPMPNFHGRRLTNAHETLLWCSKSRKARYRFNYRSLKRLNGEKQMRSDWHLPVCGKRERLRDEEGAKIHPTQKPLALLYRVLLASTRAGDVVLDPFCGSGTTAEACLRLGRHYVGIEREARYVQAARNRLDNLSHLTAKQESLLLDEPREQARDVPFAALLENGLLAPGEQLESACRHHRAFVTSEGLLSREQRRASIHQWAAELKGQTSCNGWTYWHRVEEKENTVRVPLQDLREALRRTWRAAAKEEESQKESRENSQEDTQEDAQKDSSPALAVPKSGHIG